MSNETNCHVHSLGSRCHFSRIQPKRSITAEDFKIFQILTRLKAFKRFKSWNLPGNLLTDMNFAGQVQNLIGLTNFGVIGIGLHENNDKE